MPVMSGRSVALILGGARSGKSRRAEALASQTDLAPLYVATATAGDDEMRARIAEHRARRDSRWESVEEPLALAALLARESRPDRVILIDCLTLWLTNLMLGDHDRAAAESALLQELRLVRGPVILVSNEVGLGIVPDNSLARAFRDAQGRLNQSVAACADRVEFMAAGLPLVLKPQASP